MATVRLGDQLPVGQGSGVDDPLHGVTEDMRVVAVVESPLQFLKVAVQVLDAHLVKGADDGTLEQAPHALYAVGVNIAHNPLLGNMAHCLMSRVVIRNPQVGLEVVGVYSLSLILDRAPDESVQGFPFDVRDPLDSDFPAALG